MSEMTDQYRLTDLLQGGAGEAEGPPAAGQVWAARRRSDGRAVVIKFLADGDQARREADLARAVDHAHVIVPEAIVEADGLTGVVTPLAAGGSITSLLDVRGRLPWAEVLTVLIPIADALAAAHERELIHGDISTGNILLDGSGRPLLADFGASRAAAERGGTVAVTPTTAAPELARGRAPDERSDLFALGAVAMWCLTGRPAWPADDLRDVLVQSAAGQWPDVPDSMAPAPLIAAVRQLLAADPPARGSAAELAVTLRRVGTPEPVGGLGVAAPGAAIPATMVRADALRPPAERGSVRRPRRAVMPLVVGGAIAVALLAGALTVGWWWAAADGTGATVVATAPRGVDSSAAPLGVGPATSAAATGTSASEAGSSAEPAADTGQASQSVLAPEPAEDEEPDTVSTAPEPEEPDWRAVVENLDWARAAALQARSEELLGAVYLDGAAARIGDEKRIAELRAAGLRPDLAIHRIEAVTVVDRLADGSVTLAIRSSLPAVTIYDDDGSDAGHTPERGAQRVLMTVAPGSDGYRIVAIDE